MILEVYDLLDPTYSKKLILTIHPYNRTKEQLDLLQHIVGVNNIYGGKRFQLLERPLTPVEEVLYGEAK